MQKDSEPKSIQESSSDTTDASETPLDKARREDEEDICGLCGKPGADKIPHPVYWPGERKPNRPYVHHECEDNESFVAMYRMTLEERRAFLQTLHNS